MDTKLIIRKIIKSALNAILSFIIFLIVVVLVCDRSRCYYELPDNMSFTIWKRSIKNECYIIPGKYKSFFMPKSNYIFSHKWEYNTMFFLNDTLNTVVLEKEQRHTYCTDTNCFSSHNVTFDSGWNVVELTDNLKYLISDDGIHIKRGIGVCHIDESDVILYKGKRVYRRIIFPWF